MRYTLTSPMIITPRLLPGVKIGDGMISIEIDGFEDSRAVFRYVISTPAGDLYEAADVRSAMIGGDTVDTLIRKGTAALLGFLCADAESYQRTMGAAEPDDGWLFSAQVAEWAYLNADELALTRCEFGD